MTSNESPLAEANSIDTREQLERSTSLIADLLYNSLQNLLICAVFTTYFNRITDSPWLFVWWAGFTGLVLFRVPVLLWVQANANNDVSKRYAIAYACIGITAICWGLSPFACGATVDQPEFVVAVLTLIIVVIGGSHAFQDDSIAIALLAVPAMVPLLVKLLADRSETANYFVVWLILVGLHVVVSHLRALRALTARRQAEQLSLVDALTGIGNRRYLDVVISEELSRAKRLRKPVSAIMIDVDWFKKFNDTYGHGAGDDCLKKVAKVVDRFARRTGDVAARYGGEEFALLLPNTDLAAASAIAEELRAAIVELSIPTGSQTVVTASFGVATVIPAIQDTSRSLIDAADTALYQAKLGGRNRVASKS